MNGIGNGVEGRSGLRNAWKPAALLCLVLAVPWSGGVSQQGSGTHNNANAGLPPSVIQPQLNTPFGPMEQTISPVEEKRLNMINNARQKGLVDDTNKLLALATELNQEIAKSNPGELSAEQMHKVAVIEKLAHSVRDKMVMPVHGPGLNMDNSPYAPFGH